MDKSVVCPLNTSRTYYQVSSFAQILILVSLRLFKVETFTFKYFKKDLGNSTTVMFSMIKHLTLHSMRN